MINQVSPENVKDWRSLDRFFQPRLKSFIYRKVRNQNSLDVMPPYLILGSVGEKSPHSDRISDIQDSVSDISGRHDDSLNKFGPRCRDTVIGR